MATHALLPAAQQVERYVRDRRDTDRTFVEWAVYFFLLVPVTLGIYALVIFYREVNRADMFAQRKAHYYKSLLDYTRQWTQESGEYDATHSQIDDIEWYIKGRFESEHKPIRAGLSLFLSIVTLGIYRLYSIYRMDRFWYQIQLTEQDFDDSLLCDLWVKLGLVKYPIPYRPDESTRRSFWMSFALTCVTLGIYGIVWDYKIYTDPPKKIFPEIHALEDSVIQIVRTATPNGSSV